MIKTVVVLGDRKCSAISIVRETLNEILMDDKDIQKDIKSTYLVIYSLMNGEFTQCMEDYPKSNIRFAVGNIIHRPQCIDLSLIDKDEKAALNQLVKVLIQNPLNTDPETLFVVFTDKNDELMTELVEVIKHSLTGKLCIADYTWCAPARHNRTICHHRTYNLANMNPDKDVFDW